MGGGRSAPVQSGYGLVILVPRAGGDQGSQQDSCPVTACIPELLFVLGETELPDFRDENIYSERPTTGYCGVGR